MKNPLFSRKVPTSQHGYSAFPMDCLENFTSCCGYLLPIYWDYLEPGDKVTCQTLLRTRTQPLSKPAMATVIERIEWFAVPIQQLYKLFGSKFYGVNDVESDLLPTNGLDDYIPNVTVDALESALVSLPTSLATQASLPANLPTQGEAIRLIDCLGLSSKVGTTHTNLSFPLSVSLLPFAAYHKIYYDHYRLTDREENNPSYYNLDSFFGTSSKSTVVTDNTRLWNFLTLHKRPYMREYFTSMQVSPLFGSQSVNASGSDITKINQWLTGLTGVSSASPTSTNLEGGGLVAPDSVNPTTVRLSAVSSPSGGVNYINAATGLLNPANIRSMYAVEKLLEVTRRAKKHYDMQTLAHFGVKVPKGIAGECFKIGTHEQFLKIGDVVSTSETSGAALGQLAGQGSSEAQSQKFHFEADSHCVLMAIYSAEPVVNYQDGFNKLITNLRASEFYKSEFDSLGMQPVFMYELCGSPVANASFANFQQVVGWNYRYYAQKSKYNRSFAGVTTSFFSEWALNKAVPSNASSLSRNFFYVWPTDMNNILQLPYSGNYDRTNMYSEDYFINQVYFDVIKSSKKTIYGEPNL